MNTIVICERYRECFEFCYHNRPHKHNITIKCKLAYCKITRDKVACVPWNSTELSSRRGDKTIVVKKKCEHNWKHLSSKLGSEWWWCRNCGTLKRNYYPSDMLSPVKITYFNPKERK